VSFYDEVYRDGHLMVKLLVANIMMAGNDNELMISDGWPFTPDLVITLLHTAAQSGEFCRQIKMLNI